MTTRDKILELMKDPNTVETALLIAKTQDVSIYMIAKALLNVFLDDYIGPEDKPKHHYSELSHVIRGNRLNKILFANPTKTIRRFLIQNHEILGIYLEIDKGDFFSELKINHKIRFAL